MNRHGYSTYRVRGGGELGVVGPGVKGRRHCIAFFAIALRLRLLRLRVAAVVVLVFGRPGLGRCVSFISFRGLFGSSKSKFFFDSEFDAKDYFKINTSFVRV